MIPLFAALMKRFRRTNETLTVTDETPTTRPRVDPLDVAQRMDGWLQDERPNPIKKTIKDFPLYEASDTKLVKVGDTKFVGDAAVISGTAMDDGSGAPSFSAGTQTIPSLIQDWYLSQGFIGYQACAILAQHWLVDKACSMTGEDAVRNGWIIKAAGEDSELSEEQHDALTGSDFTFKIKENLSEFNRFKNIFGIRVAIFHVDSSDPQYYEKPFNIDGVTPGSYKGISQIDPYWMTPMLTTQSTSDPANKHFYEPEYWIISGKKYHRSHLCIARGPQPADVLKPTYVFGGIPLTQRIYERVYAAERTANEAPLLALNKRTSAMHVDLEKVAANEKKFVDRLLKWVRYRDNHAVKVLGLEETMEQFDTSLADFDAIIMNQFQLVSAIAETPSTKLLGTSPKGFNATGEFEMKSYHEKLESTQENVMQPMLDRHYMILAKSLEIEVDIIAVFEDVASMTALEQADLNEKKSTTGERLINIGAISADEERSRIRDDRNSGYNRLTDVDANDEPGMSPENIAALQKAGSEEEKANAASLSAGNPAAAGLPVGAPPTAPAQPAETDTPEVDGQAVGVAPAVASAPLVAPNSSQAPASQASVNALYTLMSQIHASLVPNGSVQEGEGVSFERTTKPSVVGTVKPSVGGIRAVSSEVDPVKLPKLKVGGMLVSVENPRGTIRKGMDIKGKMWAAKMPHHYGFLNHTMGADGDEVDCFVGHNTEAPMVYVINQNDDSGAFDEHKCMMGFNGADEAKNAYLAAHSAGWSGMGDIVELTMDQFRQWVANGDTTQPLSAANLAIAGSEPETN